MRPLTLLAWGFCLTLSSTTFAADEPTANDLFARRIVPLLRSPEASSCKQCHLAGVELKDYFLPDSDKSFRSLRDQGLIDLDSPEKSKLLALVQMGTKDPSPKGLLAAKVARAEHEALSAWVKACVADPALKSAPALDAKDRAGPSVPPEVVRHARKDRLLESFERNVWAWRFRCMNCHTEGSPQNDKNRKEFGDRVAWVKKDGAAATMDGLLAGRLIDQAKPENSLLLRKPLNDAPHEGGVKFAPGDQGYEGFRTWLEDVATIRNGTIRTAKDLPPKETGPARFGTEIWFKLTNTPDAWAGKLLQVQIFSRDAAGKGWDSDAVATTDRLVADKGNLWQHTLTLLAPKDSAQAQRWANGKPELKPGRYLVRVSVDAQQMLAKDWKATLGPVEFIGETAFDARWRMGYGTMTTVDANRLKKQGDCTKFASQVGLFRGIRHPSPPRAVCS